MRTVLLKNTGVLLLLALLSVGLYVYLQTTGRALADSLVLAAPPPPDWSSILAQERAAEPGGEGHQPNLKADIEAAQSRLSASDYKAAQSNYQRMIEHLDKLEKYRQNPLAYDHQGWLQRAPTEQIRQRIIQGRIRHLEQEIDAFYHNIVKIIY